MPVTLDNHHYEHMKRLAKKVGPVYFLMPSWDGNYIHKGQDSVVKWQDVFSKEEMEHAKTWYSKQCQITLPAATRIDT